jgi:hypothetical protein
MRAHVSVPAVFAIFMLVGCAQVTDTVYAKCMADARGDGGVAAHFRAALARRRNRRPHQVDRHQSTYGCRALRAHASA